MLGQKNIKLNCVVSGCRLEVDEICPLLRYDAAYSGNCLPTFRGNIGFILDFMALENGTDRLSPKFGNVSGQPIGFTLDFMTLENGTGSLSGNVGDRLALYAAGRRAQISLKFKLIPLHTFSFALM